MQKELSDKTVVLGPEKSEVRGTIVAANDIESAQNMAEFLREDMASGRDADQG